MTDEERVQAGEITFKEYFNEKVLWVERLFEERTKSMEKLIAANLKEIESRTSIATVELDKHLFVLNQSKESMKEQQGKFLERSTFETEHRHLEADIAEIKDKRALKSELKDLRNFGITMAVLMVAILGLLIKYVR